jgi:hypothetical protein
MSGWPTKLFAIFTIFWGLLVLCSLAFFWMAGNYMLTEGEANTPKQLLVFALILSGGASIWYLLYRLMLKIERGSDEG